MGVEILNVICAYEPQIGLADDIKREFWETLGEVIHSIPQSEKLFLGGEVNGNVGTKAYGYDRMHRGFGYGERNSEGVSILDFAVACDLMIINSLFKKEDHLVTFKSSLTKAQIDYFVIRANNRILCKDCKVIPSNIWGLSIDYW